MGTQSWTPKHKLGIAMHHMLQAGKNPCFRIEGLRISAASDVSTNPGYLYIKDDNWSYIGKISPAGLLKVRHPSLITAKQKQLVIEAISEPERIAMNDGKITGTCCCCGRTLTNALSIELGIGPICRGFWFPDSDSMTTSPEQVLFNQERLLEELGASGHVKAASGSFAIDEDGNAIIPEPTECLGEMPTTTVFSKEPVLEMFREFKLLNDTQQGILYHMLSTEMKDNGNL